MDVVGKILEMRNGDITEVLFEHEIFVPKKIKNHNVVVTKKASVTKPISSLLGKGPIPSKFPSNTIVGKVGDMNIYQPVLDMINKGETVEDVMRKVYPNVVESSISKYSSTYRRYIRESTNGNNFFQLKRKYKSRRKKPEGTIGFSKTYGTWIKQDEYDLIIRALRKYDFKATTRNICWETRLKLERVRSTLDYLKQNKEAYKTYDRGIDEYIYVPTSGKETKVSFP